MIALMNENTRILSYQAIVRETPAIRVAALAHRGDYAQVSTAFERLTAVAEGMKLLGPSTRCFAIYYDDPTVTPAAALRSAACITVPEGWSPSDPLEIRDIPGGRYAVTLHVGPYTDLGQAYKWLYGTWLEQSGERPAAAPIVEEYLNDAKSVPSSELRTEVWLPLR